MLPRSSDVVVGRRRKTEWTGLYFVTNAFWITNTRGEICRRRHVYHKCIWSCVRSVGTRQKRTFRPAMAFVPSQECSQATYKSTTTRRVRGTHPTSCGKTGLPISLINLLRACPGKQKEGNLTQRSSGHGWNCLQYSGGWQAFVAVRGNLASGVQSPWLCGRSTCWIVASTRVFGCRTNFANMVS